MMRLVSITGVHAIALILVMTAVRVNGETFDKIKTYTKLPEGTKCYNSKIHGPKVATDPTVSCKNISLLELEAMGIKGTKPDPKFGLWFLSFGQIPGKPNHSLLIKRLIQNNSNGFQPYGGYKPLDFLTFLAYQKPFDIAISGEGFLPGEEVTIRLSSKDPSVYKEHTFCPRPLVSKNQSGRVSLEAKLTGFHPCNYLVNVSGLDPDEEFEFRSVSGPEEMKHVLKGDTEFTLWPDVVGMKGGINRVSIQLKDGTWCKLNLPWGNEFDGYLRGEK